jgi:hypothetical protein
MVAKNERVRYVSDENGNVTGVLVPIELWKTISSELETRHLLSSGAMRQRLEEAMASAEDVGFEEALSRLGVDEGELR